MKDENKTLQLQIRISSSQKAIIQHSARRAKMGMSQWILERALPQNQIRFHQLLKELKNSKNRDKSYVLAEIHDLFQTLTTNELKRILKEPPQVRLSPYWENYIAAMIEFVANQKSFQTPCWVTEIKALDKPHFVSEFISLRLYLLTHSPPCFRRRNIYIDSSIGQRV